MARCSYTKFAAATPAARFARWGKPITAFFQELTDLVQDPVLRRWRWQQLWHRRPSPALEARPLRPGDDAVLGRRLYGSGLTQGDTRQAEQGLQLLLRAAQRGIGTSGITLEGSTLRQRQLALVFGDAWLAARRNGRPEQTRLAAIAGAVLAALKAITLAGGLPEIGAAPEQADVADPTAQDQAALAELAARSHLFDLELLRQDGWLRLDSGAWSGLWLCPPGGWIARDGLAHHDLGAAELHWRGLPLFVDPGAPPDPALAALCRSGAAHGGLSLDGQDPYPDDRPGYDESFRRAIAGAPPTLRTSADGVRLGFDGFLRQGGHRRVERHWRFDGDRLRLEDLVLGTGRPRIERRLITPWSVSRDGDSLLLTQGSDRLRLTGEMAARLYPARLWRHNGEEIPLTLIQFSAAANLPWRGALNVTPAP